MVNKEGLFGKFELVRVASGDGVGFLCYYISQAFYLEQTLDDPSETKKDIRAHGYDCTKLQKLTATA